MDIINKINITNNIYINDSSLFVDKPVVVKPMPSIDPSMINYKYLKIETPDTILEYFNDILNNHMRIQVINGIYVYDNISTYYCDYCNTEINDNWFYCVHCNKDMCKLCYEETSEEIALKNGAQNYKKREKKLNECHSYKQIKPRNMYNIITPIYIRTCDLCNQRINVCDNFYSIKDEYDTYDICYGCYQNNDDAKSIIETKSMSLIDVNDKSNYYFNHTEFGSMLYWFPIVSDIDGCNVLMNLNPDHVNCGKICLMSSDDHGRCGYYIIRDETYDLQRVLQRLKEICDKGTYESEELMIVEDGVYEESTIIETSGDAKWVTNNRKTIKEPKYEWITQTYDLCKGYHSSPIQVLMQEFNMPIYYG